ATSQRVTTQPEPTSGARRSRASAPRQRSSERLRRELRGVWGHRRSPARRTRASTPRAPSRVMPRGPGSGTARAARRAGRRCTRGCGRAPAPSRAAASTRAVLLPVEPVLGDVALYRTRNEEADRSMGCDASADGGGRDIEAGDALKAQHVPRLVKERLTAGIVPEGLPSRKGNIL